MEVKDTINTIIFAAANQSATVKAARKAHRKGLMSSEMLHDIEYNAFEVREKIKECLYKN